MRFAMLGSGSRGNATLIEAGATRVLVDCGFNLGVTESRLQRLGIEPGSISAILVTHEHGDHLGGVARLARRHGIEVWMTPGTCSAWGEHRVEQVRLFSPHADWSIGDLHVQPYPVPHDAREPCQYVFAYRGLRVGILSDAGAVTPYMQLMLDRCDALMLECNHDSAMLAAGPYPYSLKHRVGGGLGHLSNEQSAALLRGVDRSRLQHLVLTHLSETNNTPELALRAARDAMQSAADWIVCAGQDEGLAWREVA
ncbi:MAG: fold metallo-hydrolase [Hydrocarboniphaga sp.]|uniref:MBL fold metallo-hydrolase n=1 Tax=Hydrocarboniphaga sp. TaxID=2033016 RepID=UPI00262B36C1|nr:MBL fold metallo-hydrolase [Hydrocarboniphaga sp.]MDB5970992.1 fold metallo-hydrolase [Hydrocarboniphaga sp.]